MVISAGFEPTTPGLGILCSILLSYETTPALYTEPDEWVQTRAGLARFPPAFLRAQAGSGETRSGGVLRKSRNAPPEAADESAGKVLLQALPVW